MINLLSRMSGHMLLSILSGFTYNIMSSGIVFFFIFFWFGPFVIYYSFFGFGILDCFYSGSSVYYIKLFIHKRWIRSSLIDIYNTTTGCIIYFYEKIAKLNLEWGITSPPKPHTFVRSGCPLHSSFLWNVIYKFSAKFSWVNLIIMSLVGILSFYFKNELTDLLLSWSSVGVSFKEEIIAIFMGLISSLVYLFRNFLSSILEGVFECFNNPINGGHVGKIKIDSNIKTYLEVKTDKATSGSNTVPDSSDIVSHLKSEMEGLSASNQRFLDVFKSWNEIPTFEGLDWNKHKDAIVFVRLLQDQADMVNKWFINRMTWIETVSSNIGMSAATINEINDIHAKVRDKQNEYLEKVSALSDKEGRGVEKHTKEFFALSNGFRNDVNKLLNKVDNIMHDGIRRSYLYKDPEVKKIFNQYYPEFKKAFAEEDAKLRKKCSEFINSKKKD